MKIVLLITIIAAVIIQSLIIENYTIQSTLIKKEGSMTRRNTDENCNTLKLVVSNVEYELCIINVKLSETSVIDPNAEIFMQDGSKFNIAEDTDLYLTMGYALNRSSEAYVKGYVHNSRFYGRMIIQEKIYHIEPLQYFPELIKKLNVENLEDAVIFDRFKDELKIYFDDDILSFSTLTAFSEDKHNSWKFHEKISGLVPLFMCGKSPSQLAVNYLFCRRKVCPLLVATDNSFLQRVGRGSVTTTVKIIASALDEVNAIFRSTDFDADTIPDNVGIVIRKIVILSSENSSQGSLVSAPITEPVDPKLLLQRFTFLSSLDPSCLGVLISGQTFIKHYLGVSFTPRKNFLSRYTAGICAKRNLFGIPLNTLVVTFALNSKALLPLEIAHLNLAHELAHAFGSDHDEGVCRKEDIMTAKTSLNFKKSTYTFSDCSKRDITFVLKMQGDCLEDTFGPYCGNGLIEENEDCDCGSSYYCSKHDRCCEPRFSPDACRVNKRGGHQCHPSQGLCCTDFCEYRDMSHLGLDCSKITNECPCIGNFTECSCGLHGTCIDDECHSLECARINLKECSCAVANEDICVVCCINKDGMCEPSSKITKDLLSSAKNDLVERLMENDWTDVLHLGEKQETLCVKTACFNLTFREAGDGDYCIHKGNLGVCIRSACVAQKFTANKYPSKKAINHAENVETVYVI